jgi:hypothetical protein
VVKRTGLVSCFLRVSSMLANTASTLSILQTCACVRVCVCVLASTHQSQILLSPTSNTKYLETGS